MITGSKYGKQYLLGLAIKGTRCSYVKMGFKKVAHNQNIVA
jgi:hypothetical protein